MIHFNLSMDSVFAEVFADRAFYDSAMAFTLSTTLLVYSKLQFTDKQSVIFKDSNSCLAW